MIRYSDISVNTCEDNYEDFKFLEEYIEPFDDIIEKWKNCFAIRWAILQDNKIETAEYLAKFPIFALNDNNIFKLVSRF